MKLIYIYKIIGYLNLRQADRQAKIAERQVGPARQRDRFVDGNDTHEQ